MIGVDTNVLLRWLIDAQMVDDDAPDQTRVVEDLILQSGEQFFVNHIVIAETIWVLRNKVGQKKNIIRDVVERILHSANVVVLDSDTVSSALNTFINYPGDFSDHLIGEVNRKNGCRTTMTFDKAASKSPNFSELKR
ncbi:PIN domain-containing protein [Pararhizobium sp. DWP3-4]|uniref:PIN domain-containing protein n=1 Tax=Pararhizobium sp. DWP3-4 TaxID=2804565 RepID=UPI003CE78B87